jgi:tetratricopeptide (TPR) repeat protein
MKDFFVSYNQADARWAEWIAWHLEEAGYTTVLQAWDFRPGSNFVLNMQKASEDAERTIAVLTPNYLAARFTQPEWAAAFAQDPTGEKGLLIPVRVRECELKGLLPQIVYIDLTGLEEEVAKEELLKGINVGRAKPLIAPHFPGTVRRAATQRPRFPGSIAPIWNVPHNRNPNFTGREEILTNLRTHLLSNQSVSLVQAIHGLGGVGKTQVAVEFIYRHVNEYEIVWWIRAEGGATLSTDFSNLAKELGLPQQDLQDQRLVIEAVRKWLGLHTSWLLVFDNATDPTEIRNYIPQGGSGHVIVTSRNPNWRGLGDSMPVRVLGRPEAISFLTKRVGKSDEKCGELAEELGYLPLALEQAGAYIEETGKSLTEYLELFRQCQIELLGRGNVSTNYPDTVRTTWNLSFQRAVSECPAVTGVLALVGFLAPENIPQSLLNKIVEISTPPDGRANFSKLDIDTAVATLRRYSLLDMNEGQLFVHRLVQAVSRDYLKYLSDNLAAGALGIINSVFPLESDDPRNWGECSSLLPHALAAINHASASYQVFYPAVELLNKLAMYFIGRAEYENAREGLEHALLIAKSIYGENSTPVADIRSNLGIVYHYLGQNQTAMTHLRNAFNINSRERGADDISLGSIFNSFALILRESGDIEGSLANYIRASEIAEAAYGPNDPRVAITLDNIGCVLADLVKIDEALANFKRALKIDENYYGPNHPQVATHLNHIANVYAIKGRISKALPKARRALQIREEFYDANHPLVALSRLCLGVILRDANDTEGARRQIEQALQVLIERYGDKHPDTVKARRILAELLDSSAE